MKKKNEGWGYYTVFGLILGFVLGMSYIAVTLGIPEFDFSEQNGGRCSETVIDAFARCTRFEVCGQATCREEFDDNVTQKELDAVLVCKYWLDRKEDCAFVTNSHNFTVPYEIAKERGFE